MGERGHPPPQIDGIVGLAQPVRPRQHLAGVEEAVLERDLLEARDLDALPVLDGAHEGRCLVEAFMRTGVEPGIAAAEPRDGQVAPFEIGAVDVGDLQLAARRRLDRRRDVEDVVVSAQGERGFCGFSSIASGRPLSSKVTTP